MPDIALQRTFGRFNEPADGDNVDWTRYFSSGGQDRLLTWQRLHEQHVVVVLGESGIGKTTEFKLEAQRLVDAGKPAFLVALSSLETPGDWSLALDRAATSRFAGWLKGGELGYFHLDSVDEARLTSHSKLDRALAIVGDALEGHLARVRVVISSRVSDWTEPEVEAMVVRRLLVPINEAMAQAAADEDVVEGAADTTDVKTSDQPARNELEDLLVTTLEPLSREEAKRFARFIGLHDEAGFWTAVDDGDYLHMATRPMDLQRMVKSWHVKPDFGTYMEMCETSVTARLAEPNLHYRKSGKALAPERLRAAAEELAAAAEFGGVGFIAFRQEHMSGNRLLDPYAVLTGLNADEVQQLLNTAIFDEASFNLARFHRSVREYLAACWVDRVLMKGVPLDRAKPLFAVPTDGRPTLLAGRRSTLSWLAAMNVHAREWVVQQFPSLVLYDGDPVSWDAASVKQAFDALITDAANFPELTDFRNYSAEARVARVLGGAPVAEALKASKPSWQTFSLALRLANSGRLVECADPLFSIYRDRTRPDTDRTAALSVLKRVATPAQRAALLTDILSGELSTNAMLANALPATQWQSLTDDQLTAILENTSREIDSGTGPMASAVKDDLLPAAGIASAAKLLSAVLRSLPQPESGKPFARYPEEHQPTRAWLFQVLPDCLERLLELMGTGPTPPLDLCVRAALEISQLRDSNFLNGQDTKQLRMAIERLPALRKALALELSRRETPRSSRGRLVWDANAIVLFEPGDLEELIQWADAGEQSAESREIWFSLALEVAAGKLPRGTERAYALHRLCELSSSRWRSMVFKRLAESRDVRRSQRAWARNDQERRAEELAARDLVAAGFAPRLVGIKDNTDLAGLRELMHRVTHSPAWLDSGAVDLKSVATQFGRPIAEAFASGIAVFWRTYDAPDPADRGDGGTPVDIRLAIAGVHAFLERGGQFADATDAEAARAGVIASWGPRTPEWFDELFAAKPDAVAASLNSRVLRDAQLPHVPRGALPLAINANVSARRHLLAGVEGLVLAGMVLNEDLVRRLLRALSVDGLMKAEVVDEVCLRHLDRHSSASFIPDLTWLRIWSEYRPSEAWTWFDKHLSAMASHQREQFAVFASAMVGIDWLSKPSNDVQVKLLLDVASRTQQLGSTIVPPGDEHNSEFGPPTGRLLAAIAGGLVEVRGEAGHQALQILIDREPDEDRRWHLRRLQAQHAERDASSAPIWSPERLRSLHAAFDAAPTTEALLFEQVMARLEEIQLSMEKGKFSERGLFHPQMPEPLVQLWLANRLDGTRGRRFTVHREEEVDLRKRPDIQCSCAPAVVCIEIKPVGVPQGYSANSLIKTLQEQIVEQYLRGTNSASGILVLFQLDHKRWDLPHGHDRSFDELVPYLQGEADRIKRESTGVKELRVVAIRCVTPMGGP